MTTRPDDASIDAALRALDPAPREGLTPDEQDRAEAMFDQIVASPSPGRGAKTTARRPRRRAAAGAAAAAVMAAIAAPFLVGGGGAFASWTPTPEPLAGSNLAAVESGCRDQMGAFDESLKLVLAEQRGEWIYVKLAGDSQGLTCLLPEDFVGSSRDNSGGMGSFTPDGEASPDLAADGFDEGSWATQFLDDEMVTYIDGYVGSSVASVDVHVSTGLDIEASVANGRYAVWWPGQPQSSEVPAETYTYTVTLADGSTREIDPSSLYGD